MANTQAPDKSSHSNGNGLLDKLKKYRLVAILVAAATILSGVATFTDSVDKIWKFVSSRFIDKNPEILSTTDPGEFAWTKDRLLKDGRFRIDSWDKQRYSIALHVTLCFKNDAYNSLIYLKSVEEFYILDSSGKRITRGSRGYLEETHRRINKTVFFNFIEKPPSNDSFVFITANYTTDFVLGDIDWTKYSLDADEGSSTCWYGAQLHLKIVLPDPSWPILRHIRLLRGEPPILELLLDNRSSNPLPINNVVIKATHPHPETNPRCFDEDIPQRVVLAWPSSLEKQSNTKSWTKIFNQRIEVETEFSFAGMCSDYSFRATVPVIHEIPAKNVARLLLTISELPKPEPILDPWNLGSLPSSVTHWSKFSVAVDPANEIFPNSLPVE